MPSISTYSAKFVQSVTIKFQCEYCGSRFESQGEYSSLVRLQKWEPSYKMVKPPDAELLAQGISNLEEVRDFHRRSIVKELITSPLRDNCKIDFNKGDVCPECGYRQRCGISPKISMKTIIARIFFLGGCAIALLAILGAALYAIITGTSTDAAYAFAAGCVLILGFGTWFLMNTDPNRKFIKEHGLTKDQLPEPKIPEFVYGEIITKGEYE